MSVNEKGTLLKQAPQAVMDYAPPGSNSLCKDPATILGVLEVRFGSGSTLQARRSGMMDGNRYKCLGGHVNMMVA